MHSSPAGRRTQRLQRSMTSMDVSTSVWSDSSANDSPREIFAPASSKRNTPVVTASELTFLVPAGDTPAQSPQDAWSSNIANFAKKDDDHNTQEGTTVHSRLADSLLSVHSNTAMEFTGGPPVRSPAPIVHSAGSGDEIQNEDPQHRARRCTSVHNSFSDSLVSLPSNNGRGSLTLDGRVAYGPAICLLDMMDHQTVINGSESTGHCSNIHNQGNEEDEVSQEDEVPSDDAEDTSADWGKLCLLSSAPIPSWARRAWEKRGDSTRRNFQHQLGAAGRSKQTAQHCVAITSGADVGWIPDITPSPKSSRLVSLARSRADTIGDTSEATSCTSAARSSKFKSHDDEISDGIVAESFYQVNTSRAIGSSFVRKELDTPGNLTGAAPCSESNLASLTLRWNARVHAEICSQSLHAWYQCTHASLFSKSASLRSKWAEWRKIVTALSARRRLAVYVLATRQRLSNALEIWIDICSKSRALARLGWLHKEKLLSICLQSFRIHVDSSKTFQPVALAISCVFFSVILKSHLRNWFQHMSAHQHTLHHQDMQSRRLTRTMLHAWLGAVSRTRTAFVAAEWKACEQVEHTRRRIFRYWRRFTLASNGRRRQLLFTAFQRLFRHLNFGCYRHAILLSTIKRRRLRMQRSAILFLFSYCSQSKIFAITSDRIRTHSARRTLRTFLGRWKYMVWHSYRVALLHEMICLRVYAKVLQMWDSVLRDGLFLNAKAERLCKTVRLRRMGAFLTYLQHHIALQRKIQRRERISCIKCTAAVMRRLSEQVATNRVFRHKELIIERKTNRRRKLKVFVELAKWHELRLALAVNSFRVRLRARNLMAQSFRNMKTFVFQRQLDRNVLLNLQVKNQQTRQAQAVVWWCERQRQIKFKLQLVDALRFGSIGRLALQAWMAAIAASIHCQRFEMCVIRKMHQVVKVSVMKYFWNLLSKMMQHTRALSHIKQALTLQDQEIVHITFSHWAMQPVVGQAGRMLLVKMQVTFTAQHLECSSGGDRGAETFFI